MFQFCLPIGVSETAILHVCTLGRPPLRRTMRKRIMTHPRMRGLEMMRFHIWQLHTCSRAGATYKRRVVPRIWRWLTAHDEVLRLTTIPVGWVENTWTCCLFTEVVACSQKRGTNRTTCILCGCTWCFVRFASQQDIVFASSCTSLNDWREKLVGQPRPHPGLPFVRQRNLS